mmetsp:Transcript_38768/g.116514  ORF Transcript_38768/g.116514 Transcript_38768/m.116514 type:complete len:296 (-) Transcript_38768:119-1006(-)
MAAIIQKPPPPTRYFTEFTTQKAVFYFLAVTYMTTAAIVVTIEPFVPVPCTSPDPGLEPRFENPAYLDDPCRRTRFWQLLFLTAEECMFGRRIVWSVVLGGIVGWERRQADRPAGIRTMSLVSLGSCLFTVNSAFAFLSGPMSWDASRISAAIPSGVGFLGAGMIFKEASKDRDTGQSTHVVHGLTTAASLWLSAAVGIACGGGLYFPASFCVAIMLVLLRFGPRHNDTEDEEDEDDQLGQDGDTPLLPYLQRDGRESDAPSFLREGLSPLNKQASISLTKRPGSRSKAQLASIV